VKVVVTRAGATIVFAAKEPAGDT